MQLQATQAERRIRRLIIAINWMLLGAIAGGFLEVAVMLLNLNRNGGFLNHHSPETVNRILLVVDTGMAIFIAALAWFGVLPATSPRKK